MAQSIKATFELHYIKGKCYIELKKYLDTINECDKAIELAHNKPKPHYLKVISRGEILTGKNF